MRYFYRAAMAVIGFTMASSNLYAAGDPAKGEALTVVCAACHGADGNSPGANFPKLAGLGEKYIYKQLVDIKTPKEDDGRPIVEMTGLLDALSDQELKDIAAFYASKTMQLSGAKEMSVLVNAGIEVDAIKLGEKIYRAGNAQSGVAACSGCHSPTGKGNAPAGYPRLGGQHADYIAKQLMAFRAGERINDGEAMTMRGVAKHMSDAEIKSVANYISGLH